MHLSLLRLEWSPPHFVPGKDAIAARSGFDGNIKDQCLRVSQGASVFDSSGAEHRGNYAPRSVNYTEHVRKKRTPGQKPRGVVVCASSFFEDLAMKYVSDYGLDDDDCKTLVYARGKAELTRSCLTKYVGNDHDYQYDHIICISPWGRDFTPCINNIKVGSMLIINIPIVDHKLKKLRNALVEGGFEIEKEEVNFAGYTHLACIRLERIKFTFSCSIRADRPDLDKVVDQFVNMAPGLSFSVPGQRYDYDQWWRKKTHDVIPFDPSNDSEVGILAGLSLMSDS